MFVVMPSMDVQTASVSSFDENSNDGVKQLQFCIGLFNLKTSQGVKRGCRKQQCDFLPSD